MCGFKKQVVCKAVCRAIVDSSLAFQIIIIHPFQSGAEVFQSYQELASVIFCYTFETMIDHGFVIIQQAEGIPFFK